MTVLPFNVALGHCWIGLLKDCAFSWVNNYYWLGPRLLIVDFCLVDLQRFLSGKKCYT